MSFDTKKIEFSVAVATYNRADIILDTLGHILRQAYGPHEIVVVDDGSDDSTSEVIHSMPDTRIRYHRIDNAGPGTALKTAIDLCTSKWITICDDDDIWLPNHLQRRAQLLLRYPKADFTFSDFTVFGPGALPDYSHYSTISTEWWNNLGPTDTEGYRWLGKDLFGNFLRENPVFPLTACFSQKLWEKLGGIDDRFSRFRCWDAHLTWKLALHGNVACDTQITAKRREHLGNFSKQRSQANLERATMLKQSWDDGWIPSKYRELVDQQIAFSEARAADWAWNDHDYETLRKIIRKKPIQSWNGRFFRNIAGAYLPKTLLNNFRQVYTNRLTNPD